MHNRLTHSQKVAQVAKSIAQRLLVDEATWDTIHQLGGIDADVVETAALAHDLGHPPFGHIGEMTLDKIARRNDPQSNDGFEGLKLPDGFEGNAQTFRTVLLTETRSPNYDGVDLTCASLVAIAKYPWLRAETVKDNHESKLDTNTRYRRTWRKFSVYEAEEEAFAQARVFLNGPEATSHFPVETQSLEASIMDAADDITYAIHDLEDFYLAGVLDVLAVVEELEDVNGAATLLGKLRGRLSIDYPGYYEEDQFEEARKGLCEQMPVWFSPKYEGDLDKVGRARAIGSQLIGRYINSVAVKPTLFWENGPFVALGKSEWHEVQILKEVMRKFVITRPDIAMLQRGQQKVLKKLVCYLFEWKESHSDFKRLPRRLRQEIEIARDPERLSGYVREPGGPRPYAPRGKENRCILDYICGLTDGQCYSLYYKLSGVKPSTSAMDFVS